LTFWSDRLAGISRAAGASAEGPRRPGGDADARSTLERSPLYPRLPVVERNAVVDLDDDQFFALRNPTALSIPSLLTTTAPALLAAARM
jgi:hypothetical protein